MPISGFPSVKETWAKDHWHNKGFGESDMQAEVERARTA